MNHSPSPARSDVPGLRAVFTHDLTFAKAVRVTLFLAFVALGVAWATRPNPDAPPFVDLTFEKAAGRWVPPIALAGSGLALAVAGWRWWWIRKVFTQGAVIQGSVVEMKTDTWRTSANVDQRYGTRSTTRTSYYVTVRFTAMGPETTKRLKLARGGSSYGLQQGGTVDLMVLDSAPNKPLIRAVYQGHPSNPRPNTSSSTT